MSAKTTTHISRCGRSRSGRNKLFSAETIAQHDRMCPECKRLKRVEKRRLDDGKGALRPGAICDFTLEPDLELTQLIASDEPDGAFWAIANELGEW